MKKDNIHSCNQHVCCLLKICQNCYSCWVDCESNQSIQEIHKPYIVVDHHWNIFLYNHCWTFWQGLNEKPACWPMCQDLNPPAPDWPCLMRFAHDGRESGEQAKKMARKDTVSALDVPWGWLRPGHSIAGLKPVASAAHIVTKLRQPWTSKITSQWILPLAFPLFSSCFVAEQNFANQWLTP